MTDPPLANVPPGEANRRLTTLEQLLAISAPDVPSMLAQATDLLATTLGIEKVDVFLLDEASQTLVAVGTSDTPMGRAQHAFGLDRMPLVNGGRLVEVYRSGEPYQHGHVDQDDVVTPGIRLALGVRSMLAVPITVGEQIEGVLGAATSHEEAFGPDDQSFLMAVARWIGLLLRHTETSERIARDAAERARRTTAEEIITTFAHDLGNYLTPLYGRLEILQVRAQLDQRAEDEEQVLAILRRMERMREMMRRLLDVARLEHGIFALHYDPLDLAWLVGETADLISTAVTPIDIHGTEILIVRGDPERLRQVIQNLLTNAQRHSPAERPITVELRRETAEGREWAVTTVHDEGPGIAPSVLPRLFDRFAVGPASEGLGLGLYLSRSIAEAHGGTLTVATTHGSGTTFRLALPLLPDPE